MNILKYKEQVTKKGLNWHILNQIRRYANGNSKLFQRWIKASVNVSGSLFWAAVLSQGLYWSQTWLLPHEPQIKSDCGFVSADVGAKALQRTHPGSSSFSLQEGTGDTTAVFHGHGEYEPRVGRLVGFFSCWFYLLTVSQQMCDMLDNVSPRQPPKLHHVSLA